jgi:hypothetical protein
LVFSRLRDACLIRPYIPASTGEYRDERGQDHRFSARPVSLASTNASTGSSAGSTMRVSSIERELAAMHSDITLPQHRIDGVEHRLAHIGRVDLAS